MNRKRAATAFVCVLTIASILPFVLTFGAGLGANPGRFACYLLAALGASTLKIVLPGIEGTMSVNFVFILLGILHLSLAQVLVIGLAAVLVQTYWKPKRALQPIQVVFNLSQLTLATAVAYGTFEVASGRPFHWTAPAALLVAAIAYFGFNTFSMAIIIGLTEDKRILEVWRKSYFWSFPNYLLAASLAWLINWVGQYVGWQAALLVLPPTYLIYRSYKLYVAKLETEKLHIEQISNLHLRTIETLALAIEAKDHTTHAHLQRVRIYAAELAKDLGLTPDEFEALRAASLLHDIGKLAVPEHIISKPGKLTPEEFDKMKIHPIVGAEIVEQIEFPYPVAPIVRAHHEKWDGSGYPSGLKGEEIPMGARILSAVDCLDALASDRQYRKALSLDEAMARVKAESGTSFDPRVVTVLERRYKELEELATRAYGSASPKLSTDIKISRGSAPDAGFAEIGDQTSTSLGRINVATIADAEGESQTLLELSQNLRAYLSLDDTLSIIATRLRRLIRHEALAIFAIREGILIPQFVSGENHTTLSSLRIPVGEGLAGWVAENNKAILNGNPGVEPGFGHHPTRRNDIRSALAVPLGGQNQVVGVLVLYRRDTLFSDHHLRVLVAFCSKLGLIVEREPSSGADGENKIRARELAL